MSKRKIPLQGKGRQFRADLWLDEKITGRTLHVLRQQGVRFPGGRQPAQNGGVQGGVPAAAGKVPPQAHGPKIGQAGRKVNTQTGPRGRVTPALTQIPEPGHPLSPPLRRSHI